MPWPFDKRQTREPWRKVTLQYKDYREAIDKFKPNRDEVEHIRVMLYGPVGSGKSSIINTIESALRGRITAQALSDGIGHDSFTTKFKTHRVKKWDGAYYPFLFMDLMGLEKSGGVKVSDIRLALQGHAREGYQFNPETGLNTESEFYNSSPTINDKTHVLVCVVPANTVSLLEDDFIKKMRKVRLAARDLEIPQMAILTKVDDACPKVSSDLKKVYRSKIIEEKVTQLSTSLGIQPNLIFPVKNYHTEVELVPDIDKLTLMVLKQILDLGTDYVDSHISNCH